MQAAPMEEWPREKYQNWKQKEGWPPRADIWKQCVGTEAMSKVSKWGSKALHQQWEMGCIEEDENISKYHINNVLINVLQ